MPANNPNETDARLAKIVLLRDYTRTMAERIAALRGRATGDGQTEALAQAIQELEVTREELTVADEEIASAAQRFEEATRRLEAELRHYRDLFDGAPDGYLLTDPFGVIREGNATAAGMLGVHKRFLEGKPLVNFVARGDVRAYRDALALTCAPAPATEPREDGAEPRLSAATMITLRMRPRDGKPIFTAEIMRRPVRGVGDRITSIRWSLRSAASNAAAVLEDAGDERE